MSVPKGKRKESQFEVIKHSHTVGTASQTHTHSGTTSDAGSGTAFDVRPKYFKLAFIMKVV